MTVEQGEILINTKEHQNKRSKKSFWSGKLSNLDSIFNSCDIYIIRIYEKDVIVHFLSDPSPIIGYACHSLTDSLTQCCLVSLIDVTLACEDAYSKLVAVVTFADVSNEDCVGNSLLQIWKLSFGHKA